VVKIYYGGEIVNILGGAKGRICWAYILVAQAIDIIALIQRRYSTSDVIV